MSRRRGRRSENESSTIRKIENQHCTKSRRKIYVALEKVNFIWDEKEVVEIDAMWEMGISIHIMAESFDRPINDVFVLLWDRLEEGHIKHRKGFIWGRSA